MAMHSIIGTLHQRCSKKTSIVVVVALLTSCLFVLFLFELNAVDSSRIHHRFCREWPPPLENGLNHHAIFQKNDDNNHQPHSHSSAKWNDDKEETRLTQKTLFATTTTNSHHHLLFLNFSHAKDQEIKDTLRPNGAGIFWKQDSHNRKLPVGISVFHAMHCLIYLRGILQDVLLTPEQEEVVGNKKHHHEGHDPKTHIPHCWSYITQQVMCLGDTTLEPARVVDNKVVGIDGDGVEHMCKDLGGILADHGLLGRMGRGEVFEGLAPWRDGQRLEDLFSF